MSHRSKHQRRQLERSWDEEAEAKKHRQNAMDRLKAEVTRKKEPEEL